MSSIGWLADKPRHWEALDLKFVVARISSGVSVNATDQPANPGEPGVLKTSAAIGGRFLPDENKAVWEAEYERLACPVKAESIIVSRMNTPALVGESGYVENDYPSLFLPDRLWQIELNKSRAFPRFVALVLSSSIVRWSLSEMATGTSASMKNLSQEDLLNFAIPLPPISEQHEIVRRIAVQTAEIDTLIAAKQRLLDLLAEKRRAIVAEAVMRGLNPSAPPRASGIAWLGDIPHHWEAIPLRFLVSISGGATPDTRILGYWNGTIPWVSPKDMKRDYIDEAEDHVSEAALDNSALKMIEPDAILIVVRGMILAHSFPTAINTVPVTINQDMKALRCTEKILPAFLTNVLKGARDYLVSLADSSAHGTKKLETETLGRFEVPVPPMDEQHEIVRHIATKAAKIDRLCAATEHSIALLNERRIALIAAAVTGQIAIPNSA